VLAAGISLFDRSGTPRVRDARYLGMLPPLSIVDRRNPDAAIYLATDEDSSPEIQFGEGQRCIEWTCSRPRKMPWRGRPVNHETNLRMQMLKVKIN
jgi:hypothetical protein